MGFIDTLLLDWHVALASVRADDDVRSVVTALAVTIAAVFIVFGLVRTARPASFAAVLLESHIFGLALQRKEGWLRSLL